MEWYAWKGFVREGMLDEYKKRHDEIWPEMSKMLTDAGIKDYTIWNVGNELFGCYAAEKGADYALKFQAQSEVVARWNVYMDDVMYMATDPDTGKQLPLMQMFFHG